MTFVTLFHGQKIAPAPGKKILLSEEYSELLNVQELLEKTRTDIEEFHKEAAEEAAALKKKSQDEGFQAGLNEWTSKFVDFERELKHSILECEKAIAPMAIQAAKKVVGKELEIHPETLVDIVKQGLKAVRQHRTFRIIVNRKDLELLDSKRPELKEGLEQVESLTVLPRDDIKPGNAMIETEKGIINLDLELVWQSLEKALLQLLAPKTT